MESYYKKIFKDVAEEFNVPISKVIKAYLLQYRFIVEKIKELPFSRDDITEDEFNKLRTSFNIPSIGKFYCSYKRYTGVKKALEYRRNISKNGRVQDKDD